MKKYKYFFAISAIIIIAVIFTYFAKNNVPYEVQEYDIQQSEQVIVGEYSNNDRADQSEQADVIITPKTDQSATDVNENNIISQELVLPEDSETKNIDNENEDKEYQCTLSVRCDTILKNLNQFSPEKSELLSQNGIIYPEQTVTFYEGDSVFDILLREMKNNKIHLEFSNAPLYSSAYIEGINNIYEFDCGELSGWMYSVNGSFPNYGCSKYILKEGDKVEWIYTCDLGKDIGASYSAQQE